MALQVIGAGMPRTGTLSLKTALEQLGFSPCHHMTEVFAHPEQWPYWDRVGDGLTVEWEDIFGPYRATTDAPGCYFYRELAERYPDAKVVLTERDPDKWYESMAATIFSARHREGMVNSPVGAIIAKLAGRSWAGREADLLRHGPPPRERMIEMFKAHNAEVRQLIPAERLLVYQVSEGWAPLCRFLGVPQPPAPFPRVNSAEEFHSIQLPA
jgi:hypothetical protein